MAGNVPPALASRQTGYRFESNFGIAGSVANRKALNIAHLGTRLLEFERLPRGSTASAADSIFLACLGLLFHCPNKGSVKAYVSCRVHDLGEVHRTRPLLFAAIQFFCRFVRDSRASHCSRCPLGREFVIATT